MKFIVQDTGVGIPKEEQRNLFKLFSTVLKHKHEYNVKGTGLGLTITQKLVKLLGGEIMLSSQENEGTRIEFTIQESARTKDLIPNDPSPKEENKEETKG